MPPIEVDPFSQNLGRMEATLAALRAELGEFKDNVDARFRSQGERSGQVEKELKEQLGRLHGRLDEHMNRSSTNGWRPKAAYGGGGTVVGLAIAKLLEMFLGS